MEACVTPHVRGTHFRRSLRTKCVFDSNRQLVDTGPFTAVVSEVEKLCIYSIPTDITQLTV